MSERKMLLGKAGFRALCERVVAVKSKKIVRWAQPDAEELTDTALLYGFNDPVSGLSFLVFGLAQSDPGRIVSFDVKNDMIFRRKYIADMPIGLPIINVPETTRCRIKRLLARYEPGIGTRDTRRIGYLDFYRHRDNPDLVRSKLSKGGEADIYLTGMKDGYLTGRIVSVSEASGIYKKNDDVVLLIYGLCCEKGMIVAMKK